jgi:hypothetical protein
MRTGRFELVTLVKNVQNAKVSRRANVFRCSPDSGLLGERAVRRNGSAGDGFHSKSNITRTQIKPKRPTDDLPTLHLGPYSQSSLTRCGARAGRVAAWVLRRRRLCRQTRSVRGRNAPWRRRLCHSTVTEFSENSFADGFGLIEVSVARRTAGKDLRLQLDGTAA